MILTITGVCFVDNGRLLTVRKKNTHKFMLVGGKLEPGETAIEAASREVLEEVGLTRSSDQLTLLGAYDEIAANEPGWRVSSTIFVAAPLTDDEKSTLHPRAEIAEITWLDLAANPPTDLAPLLAKHVVPALRNRLPIAPEG
ncbi:NUDIX hydrolase [Flaviflexus equikiangi]|uniref:NUDIX domain-containing protein n=1 Tax=Flaviflexus equikiangi TaxID=2758573 RepID=A0ABS2TFW5_9ACTO|nr:NUDIX domain-containing protein [Flaviflexus equikiangi]MBM9432149.1 NUDIX domain-containing protein [Flaviflexus equikiangi]